MNVVLLLVFVATAAAQELDSKRFENFDVEELLGNPRLLKSYTKCFLGEGKCTPDGTALKKTIPDTINTNCDKCTPKQKTIVARFMNTIKTRMPQEWTKLNRLYDPDSKRAARLEQFIDQYGPK